MTLNDLKNKYPELVEAANRCFAITPAVLHKLLLQHEDKKDRGLNNMLAECKKHIKCSDVSSNSVSNSLSVEESEEDKEDRLKRTLETEARKVGIELDRRMSLKNMQKDFEDQCNEESEDEESEEYEEEQEED